MKKLFLIMLATGFIGFTACTSGNKESQESDTTAIEQEMAPMEEEMEPAEEMPADTASVESDTTGM